MSSGTVHKKWTFEKSQTDSIYNRLLNINTKRGKNVYDTLNMKYFTKELHDDPRLIKSSNRWENCYVKEGPSFLYENNHNLVADVQYITSELIETISERECFTGLSSLQYRLSIVHSHLMCFGTQRPSLGRFMACSQLMHNIRFGQVP